MKGFVRTYSSADGGVNRYDTSDPAPALDAGGNEFMSAGPRAVAAGASDETKALLCRSSTATGRASPSPAGSRTRSGPTDARDLGAAGEEICTSTLTAAGLQPP